MVLIIPLPEPGIKICRAPVERGVRETSTRQYKLVRRGETQRATKLYQAQAFLWWVQKKAPHSGA